MTESIISEKVLAASNLLEQIEEVNRMIELHRSHGNGTSFSVVQYENRKARFIKELKEVLNNNFQLKVSFNALGFEQNKRRVNSMSSNKTRVLHVKAPRN
jgi:hypothetical protein